MMTEPGGPPCGVGSITKVPLRRKLSHWSLPGWHQLMTASTEGSLQMVNGQAETYSGLSDTLVPIQSFIGQNQHFERGTENNQTNWEPVYSTGPSQHTDCSILYLLKLPYHLQGQPPCRNRYNNQAWSMDATRIWVTMVRSFSPSLS